MNNRVLKRTLIDLGLLGEIGAVAQADRPRFPAIVT